MKINTGFTLLEVLVAMIILVIMAAGTFSVFTFGKHSTNLSGSQFQAMNYARQTAEDLKIAVNYSSYDTGDLMVGPHDPENIQIGSVTGTRSYVVENVDLDEDGTLESKEVTITVHWDEPAP